MKHYYTLNFMLFYFVPFFSYWLKSMKYFIAQIHTQLVQKFSIDFRGFDGDNFPNYYCDTCRMDHFLN